MQEFLARVEALLRRTRTNSVPLYLDYSDLKIDLVQRRVQVKDDFIELTPQEFSLLYVLAQAEGSAITRSELLRRACLTRSIILALSTLMFSLFVKRLRLIPANLI